MHLIILALLLLAGSAFGAASVPTYPAVKTNGVAVAGAATVLNFVSGLGTIKATNAAGRVTVSVDTATPYSHALISTSSTAEAFRNGLGIVSTNAGLITNQAAVTGGSGLVVSTNLVGDTRVYSVTAPGLASTSFVNAAVSGRLPYNPDVGEATFATGDSILMKGLRIVNSDPAYTDNFTWSFGSGAGSDFYESNTVVRFRDFNTNHFVPYYGEQGGGDNLFNLAFRTNLLGDYSSEVAAGENVTVTTNVAAGHRVFTISGQAGGGGPASTNAFLLLPQAATNGLPNARALAVAGSLALATHATHLVVSNTADAESINYVVSPLQGTLVMGSNLLANTGSTITEFSGYFMNHVLVPLSIPTNSPTHVAIGLRTTNALPVTTNFHFGWQTNKTTTPWMWATNMMITVATNWTWTPVPVPAVVLQFTQACFAACGPLDFRTLCNTVLASYAGPTNPATGQANPFNNLNEYNDYISDPYSHHFGWSYDLSGVYVPIVRWFASSRAGSVFTPAFSNTVAGIVSNALPATTVNVPSLLTLPPVLYGVEGREVNLYFDGILHDPASWAIVAHSSHGMHQEERWTYTGTAATTTVALSVYDRRAPTNLVASGTVTLSVVASNLSGGSNLVYLAIGDSVTGGGQYCQEITNLAAADSSVSFTNLGTRVAAARNEGLGGWTISAFATNQLMETGDGGDQLSNWKLDGHTGANTTNAVLYWTLTNGSEYGTANVRTLWLSKATNNAQPVAYAKATNNSTAPLIATNASGLRGSVDITYSADDTTADNALSLNMFSHLGSWFNFAWYLTNTAQPTPTHVTLTLGINDMNWATADASLFGLTNSVLPLLDFLVASIHSNSPVTRVGVALVIPPSATQDAFGANYGAGTPHRWRYKRNLELWNAALLARYSGLTSNQTYLVPLNACLDTRHGMLWSSATNVNSRSTNLVTRMSNGVHPATSGYLQMADAIWAWIKNTVN